MRDDLPGETSGTQDQPDLPGRWTAETITQASQIIADLLDASPGKVEACTNSAIEWLGQMAGADRSCLFLCRDTIYMDNVFEWCAPGIQPAIEAQQAVPVFLANIVWNAFRRDGYMRVNDLSLIVPEGDDLREALERHEIRAFVAAPVKVQGDIVGFVGHGFSRTRRASSDLDVNTLRALASAISISRERRLLYEEKAKLTRELAQERARTAAVVSAVPELLIECAPDGTIIGFHQTEPMKVALSPAEIVGQRPENVLPAHLVRIARMAMSEVDRDGHSKCHDYMLELPDGPRFYELVATQRNPEHPFHAHGYLFIVRDMTEDHERERMIRQLGRAAELSFNLVVLADARRRITWINPATERLCGYSLDDAVGRCPFYLFGLTRSCPEIASEILGIIDGGGIVTREISSLDRDGNAIWLLLSFQPLNDSEGRRQGYVISGSDITEHKRTEARTLRERAEAMDALHDGIAINDAASRFVYMNPAMRCLLGLAPDTDIAGLHWSDVLSPGFIAQFRSILFQLVENGRWEGEMPWTLGGADVTHVAMSITVQGDGGMICVLRDISEHHAAEAIKARLREDLQLAQSRQATAQLASGLAHDFGNLLTVISGSAAMLERANPDEARNHGARILSASEQAAGLVRNFLSLGHTRARRGKLDLGGPVKDAIDLLRPSIDPRTVLSVDLCSAPLIVRADPTDIMQIVLNLTLNARDALIANATNQMISGSIPKAGQVSLKMRPASEQDLEATFDVGVVKPGARYALFEVADNGPGMDADTRRKAFRPYFTTKGTQGSGLGLPIVADLVSENGGLVQLECQEGGGLCARVFWRLEAPATLDDADEQEPASKPSQSAAADLSGPLPRENSADTNPLPQAAHPILPLKGARVILVDDDDHVLLALSRILDLAGADVLSCNDAFDAIEAIVGETDYWDAVITDYGMLPINGVEFATAVKAQMPDLPVILITGHPEHADIVSAPENLFEHILTKPVRQNALVDTLVQLLCNASAPR